MAFIDIRNSLCGEVPGLPLPLSSSFINQALGFIYDIQMWSFQLKESNWLTPGLLFPSGPSQSTGAITAVAYTNTVIGNTTASAQWAAYNTAGTLPPLTALQIRVPFYSLYNIISYDTTSNPPFGTLTLDRPWGEPSGAGQSYMIYQAYFPVPVLDFKRFIDIRDTTNAAPLDYWTYSRKDLSLLDPQRTNFNNPAFVVPYEVDMRAGSPTLGYMLYELWPHPLSQLPYSFDYQRRGLALSLNTDTVPPPITEEMVLWRAKEVSYQWAEAQKGVTVARGSGADFRFLSEAAAKEYERVSKTVRDRDRDLVELYFSRFVRDAALGYWGYPFATITGGLNVGRMV